LIYQYQIYLICCLAPGIHRHQGTHPCCWNLGSLLETRIEEEDGIEERKEGNEEKEAEAERAQDKETEATEEEEEEGETEEQVVLTQGAPAVTLNLRLQTQGTGDVTTATAYADKRKLLEATCSVSGTRWKP